LLGRITSALSFIEKVITSSLYGSMAGKYIWSMGYALLSDVSPFNGKLFPNYSTSDCSWYMDPRRYVWKIKKGDVVWVASRFLPVFIKECFPRVKTQITLVVSDGDESFPSSLSGSIDVLGFLNDARLLSIFAQNVDGFIKHPKIHHLPIGLDYHTINRRGGYWGEKRQTAQAQEHYLEDLILSLPPLEQRIPKAYVDFHLSDRTIYDGTRRTDVLRQINDTRCVDVAVACLPRHKLWEKKGQYVFSISPHGNGLDCHRTWEDLILGCIVIVKTSALDPLYEGLPVVIVKEWNEITPKNLTLWLEKFVDKINDTSVRERLTLKYWMEKIRMQANVKLDPDLSPDQSKKG